MLDFAGTSMADRKAELEKKKAKLQAIREQKERLRKEKEKKDVCYRLKCITYYTNNCTRLLSNYSNV